jgi:uncharacterized cupredoxin-like copper-binding protein
MRGPLAMGAAASLLLAACSGGGNVQSVDTPLSEWAAAPAVTTVKAGKITFVARNSGKEGHELELSNKEGREIPDGASLGEAEDIAPGETKSFTLDLKPGTYELACRLQDNQASPPVNHYDKGMHVKFVVQ